MSAATCGCGTFGKPVPDIASLIRATLAADAMEWIGDVCDGQNVKHPRCWFPSGQTRSVCRRSCSNKEIERDDDPKKVIPLHEKREMSLYYSSFHRHVREGQLPEDW